MRFLGIESFARMSEYSKKPTTGGERSQAVRPERPWTRSITSPLSAIASSRGRSASGSIPSRAESLSSDMGRTGRRAASAASSGVKRISRISRQPSRATGSSGSG